MAKVFHYELGFHVGSNPTHTCWPLNPLKYKVIKQTFHRVPILPHLDLARVEAAIIDHLRDYEPDLEKYLEKYKVLAWSNFNPNLIEIQSQLNQNSSTLQIDDGVLMGNRHLYYIPKLWRKPIIKGAYKNWQIPALQSIDTQLSN